jgi:predicted DNA-binding transcriptional regulator AlpA
MSSGTSGSGTVTPTRVLDRRGFVSTWVNVKIPAWDHVLTAHDIARLTRRQRWILSTLTILGRFPKKQRFRGREIGWLRASVLVWIASRHARGAPVFRRRTTRHLCRPLERSSTCAALKNLGACFIRQFVRRLTRTYLGLDTSIRVRAL